MNNKPKWIIIVLLGLAVLTHGQRSVQQVRQPRRDLEQRIVVRDSVTLGESRQIRQPRKYLERGIGVLGLIEIGKMLSDQSPDTSIDTLGFVVQIGRDTTVTMIKYEGREIPTEKLVKVGMPENTVRRRYGRPLYWERHKRADGVFDLLFYHGIVFKIVNETVDAIIIIPVEKAKR